MRGEQDMLTLILETARQDERIRSVIMNGSRTNPAVKRDIFQDFDIIYLATETASFLADVSWIDVFGERMILQLPDSMPGEDSEPDKHFTYLIQLMDGNRIDLTLISLAHYADSPRDSLSVLLLDKDGTLAPFESPNERDYLPQPPSAAAFDASCNEFWWVAPYVAKGLWRNQIPYAKYMLDVVLREQLSKMLAWHLALESDFKVNPGAYGKYFQRYLAPELWHSLENTWSDATLEKIWDSLEAMAQLFRQVALQVAIRCDFEYPQQDDERVSAYLKHIRQLPPDAPAIYP